MEFNRATADLLTNDLVHFANSKLRGRFKKSFHNKVRSLIGNESPSSTSSTTEEEEDLLKAV